MFSQRVLVDVAVVVSSDLSADGLFLSRTLRAAAAAADSAKTTTTNDKNNHKKNTCYS
jgi:hypothetical protein